MKAVLVLDDMPETCAKCPLEFFSDVMGDVCAAIQGPGSCICEMWEDKDAQRKLSMCPLKKMPERKNTTSISVLRKESEALEKDPLMVSWYNSGFNDALGIIEGRSENGYSVSYSDLAFYSKEEGKANE